MDWKAFFDDLQKLMAASNQVMQKHPITSDEYWEWFVGSAGRLGNKYNNHPLVKIFICGVIKFQEDNYNQVTGG